MKGIDAEMTEDVLAEEKKGIPTPDIASRSCKIYSSSNGKLLGQFFKSQDGDEFYLEAPIGNTVPVDQIETKYYSGAKTSRAVLRISQSAVQAGMPGSQKYSFSVVERTHSYPSPFIPEVNAKQIVAFDGKILWEKGILEGEFCAQLLPIFNEATDLGDRYQRAVFKVLSQSGIVTIVNDEVTVQKPRFSFF